jgi:hypothetical protein
MVSITGLLGMGDLLIWSIIAYPPLKFEGGFFSKIYQPEVFFLNIFITPLDSPVDKV